MSDEPTSSAASAKPDAAAATLAYHADGGASADRRTRNTLNLLLLGGIILRLLVLMYAGPNNPDDHFSVIVWIVERGELPYSNAINQSYHPPLYHLLMAPLLAIWKTESAVHAGSFVLSCMSLLVIRVALSHPLVFPHHAGRVIAMAFASFLPQFVMFCGFVSNDTLTIFLGALIFLAMLNYIRVPGWINLLILSALVGLAYSTKGTFLLTAPAVLAIITIRLRSVPTRSTNPPLPAQPIRARPGFLPAAFAFCAIVTALGCYKYVENYKNFGTPIVHNIDAGGTTYEMQMGTYKGWQTLFDINVLKLIRRPILQTNNVFSYPLLLYGTFWYPHIPDSSFRGNVQGYAWVGSILYSLAIIPTFIFLWGCARGIIHCGRMISHMTDQRLLLLGSFLLLFTNLAVVFAAGIRYDAWSCFQSRLCFQSMLPAMVIFGTGFESLPRRGIAMKVIQFICWLTVATCLLYFAIEIGLTLQWLTPGSEVMP
jgi:hypothetical protein